MSTQTGGGTPHTCKAVEHCHTLNERVADLESELATLRTLVRSLGEELGRYRKDSLQWHNTLARESRAHDAQLAALVGHVGWLRQAVGHPDDDGRRAVVHCSTCTCGLDR